MSITPWHRPAPQIIWRAIGIYLKHAYPSENSPPPSAVRARLDTLRSTPVESFYDSPVLECSGQTHSEPYPHRYALRLGNQIYPHMKLAIDRSPDGHGYLLHADAHDSHCQPQRGPRERAAFAELSRHNHAMADAIEAAWEADGLLTFKKFLREDLERRRAKS